MKQMSRLKLKQDKTFSKYILTIHTFKVEDGCSVLCKKEL